LQEDLEYSTRLSDESLAVAMSKLASTKQRMDREEAKRKQLQEKAKQLQQQLASEKQKLKEDHNEQVQSLRRAWEDEKSTLLDAIQRDCNLVFEGQRASSRAAVSPTSVDFNFPHRNQSFVKDQFTSTQGNEKLLSACSRALHFSSYSKIDEELRETEALVEGLLVGTEGRV